MILLGLRPGDLRFDFAGVLQPAISSAWAMQHGRAVYLRRAIDLVIVSKGCGI